MIVESKPLDIAEPGRGSKYVLETRQLVGLEVIPVDASGGVISRMGYQRLATTPGASPVKKSDLAVGARIVLDRIAR